MELGVNVARDEQRYYDKLREDNFTFLRVSARDYANTSEVNESKQGVIDANAKGFKTIWGVTSNETTITSTTWPNFKAAILDAAQWAQDNGLYEFQVGNEEELHVDGTTVTIGEMRDNIREVATEVKAIFTRGRVGYATDQGALHLGFGWPQSGKGDLDYLTANLYIGDIGDTEWQGAADELILAFGVEGTYISEFNINGTSLDTYSSDATVQKEGVDLMVKYFEKVGMRRIIFFNYHDWPSGQFGITDLNDVYRELWEALENVNIPIQTGTAGTRFIKTKWPIESGLQARTEKQAGRTANLIATEGSNVIRETKLGIDT